MTFSETYLWETQDLVNAIDHEQIEALAVGLSAVRAVNGRVFIIGLGGSAAHASHAAADLRKLCQLQVTSLTDNISSFTAAANDEGWDWSFSTLLKYSNITKGDALLILSVGGASEGVSRPLVAAYQEAQRAGASRFAIFGRDGGKARDHVDAFVLIPPMHMHHVTPHTEGLMSVVLHCLVSHPALQVQPPKWESLS